MRIFSIIILISFITVSLNSATWERTFGGSGTDVGYSVIQDSEEYYIVAGYTESFGAGGRDIWLLKVDTLGDTVWTRTYGGVGDDVAYDVFETSDSCYLLTARSRSYSQYDCILIVKVNKNGDSVFTKTILHPQGLTLNSSAILPDDGLILAGYIGNTFSGKSYLAKVNANGDTVFTKIYEEYCSLTSIGYNSDGSFITTPGDSIHLIKLDLTGNKIWSVSYYDTLLMMLVGDPLKMASQNYDGGFHFVVTVGDGMSIWDLICLTDSAGNLFQIVQENKVYLSQENITFLKEIEDFGFLKCTVGTSSSGQWSTYSLSNMFSHVYYNSPWMSDSFGLLSSGYPCSDNGYIFVGSVSYFTDTYLVIFKTDSLGEVGVEEEIPVDIPSSDILNIINLGNGQVSFNFLLPSTSHIKLEIFDISGRMIATPISGELSPGSHEIPFNPERSGIYFYRLESKYLNKTGKFTILR